MVLINFLNGAVNEWALQRPKKITHLVLLYINKLFDQENIDNGGQFFISGIHRLPDNYSVAFA